MCGVGVEEAAAVGAEHLNRDLRGDRPHRDRLLAAFERCRIDIGTKGLRDALPDQEQREDNASRQQDVERAAGHIDPELSDGSCRGAREPTDQRDGQHDAGRGGDEVLGGEAQHLHEIGHRAFAAVVLPVGVGDKTDRRVEGEVRRHRSLFGRIERQHGLKPHERVEHQKSGYLKQQHRDRVGQPMLFVAFVDAARPVKPALEWTQHGRKQCALAVEDARHVPPERSGHGDDHRAKQNDLEPAVESHDVRLLELFGPQQRVGEIDQQAGGHDRGKDVVEDHGNLPRAAHRRRRSPR